MIERHAHAIALLFVLSLLQGCDKSEEMRLQRQVRELKGELADARQRSEDIKLRMQQIRARNKVLIGLVEGLTAEPDRAGKGADEGMPSAHRALEALDRDIEVLATTLKQSREDMVQLRSQRKALQTNLNEAMRTIEEGKQREARAQDRLSTYREMLLKLRSMIESEKLELQVVRNRMVVKLPEALLFESGKARIKKKGREALTRLAEILSGIEEREFEIAGHTDDVPIRNWRFKSNWDLAAARAVNVTRFLIEQGVPRARLSAAAYADTRPLASEATDEARAMNRRIEIVLLPKLDELPDLTALDGAAEPEAEAETAADAEASDAAPEAEPVDAEAADEPGDAQTPATDAEAGEVPATSDAEAPSAPPAPDVEDAQDPDNATPARDDADQTAAPDADAAPPAPTPPPTP